MPRTNTLLISGSPRRGNTEYILTQIHNHLPTTSKLIPLRKLQFNHCQGCTRCYTTGVCAMNDDMTALFQELIHTERIIIGSPLYYGNVSGLLKQFIDRTLPAYETKALAGKPLISIMVGGGELPITEQFHTQAIQGFVKYNGFNLIATYNFQAFDPQDIEQSSAAKQQITKIAKEIAAHACS